MLSYSLHHAGQEGWGCRNKLNLSKLPALQAQIWNLIVQAEMHQDLHTTDVPDDFNDFLR